MSDVWAPPQAEVKDVSVSGNPESPAIRRAHLNHEANIKAVGMLYYLAAAGLLLAAVILLIAAGSGNTAYNVGMAIACFAFFGLYSWLVRGLRAWKSSVKIPTGILAGLGLLGFPVGTLINGYILYLLFSQKGTMVFSDEYKQIIADTPDMKYRTSIIVWIFLALIVVALAYGIIAGARGH